jgi:hypothetical protein
MPSSCAYRQVGVKPITTTRHLRFPVAAFCLDNTELSGEPAAVPSLIRCNSLLDGAVSMLAPGVGYTLRVPEILTPPFPEILALPS